MPAPLLSRAEDVLRAAADLTVVRTDHDGVDNAASLSSPPGSQHPGTARTVRARRTV
jgi:hypothetical protein